MASKFTNSLALLLALNLVFFSLVSSCGDCEGGNPNPKPTPKPSPRPRPTPKPSTPAGSYPGGSPSTGGSSGSHGKGGYPGIPGTGGSSGTCPLDALKLKVCANVLGGLLDIHLGTPANSDCCPLIQGLVDLDAAVCLCTALKANILGINLNVPLSLSLLLNHCGCQVPRDFQCP